MAKKKTENIKAAPVLRASGGGDVPTPETPVITKSYCVRDDWKDKDKVNYVAFKSVDGEVQDLTVNGHPAGGGGGDFSTAKVTITNNTGNPLILQGVYIWNDELFDQLPVMTSATAYAILYKGEQKINVPDDTTVVVTGQVTVEDDYITITGVGTITLS